MTDTAKKRLATMPLTIDAQKWFEAHERKIYDLATAVMKSALSKDIDVRKDADRALWSLLDHARLVLGDSAPVVLSKNGRHEISYKEHADMRAQVRLLKAELAARPPAGQAGTLPAPGTEPPNRKATR